MQKLLFAFATLALSAVAYGQEQPIVRVKVTPESVIVGESAELTVTVLVPTWFTRPSIYPSFELANAITRLPADSSYNIRERIGNQSWSGIVRTYEIYPLLGATYRMSGQQLSVTFANPGKEPINVDVELPEVVLRGTVPDGAEPLEPYIAGRNLELNIDIEGELDDLEVGDALVVHYRASLDGLPAIFLPPLAPPLEFDGVSTYRDLPDVQDGEIASRSETVTLVFDAGGEFTIPALELDFWNTVSQSIETVGAEGAVIRVEGAPLAAPQGDGVTQNRWLPALVAGSFLLLFALWFGGARAIRRYRAAAERRRQSEPYAFKQLSRTLRSKDSEKKYRALLHWLERLEPGMSARSFATDYGDEALSEAITILSDGIFGKDKSAADLRRLAGGLGKARKRYLARRTTRQLSSLPPLNP